MILQSSPFTPVESSALRKLKLSQQNNNNNLYNINNKNILLSYILGSYEVTRAVKSSKSLLVQCIF